MELNTDRGVKNNGILSPFPRILISRGKSDLYINHHSKGPLAINMAGTLV